MKPQLSQFLTVCLLTLVVLSPAFAVMSMVWQLHLDFIATQNVLYAVKNSQKLTANAVYLLLQLMFFAPVGFCLGIVLHNRYVVYRAAALQRQVAMLERIWQRHTYLEEIKL